MRTVGHIITSAGVGCVSYWRYKSKPAALATFLAGWLIDLDHLVDYVRAHGWKPNWARFKEAEHERYSGKLYLPLHSFELLAAFYLLFRGPNKQAYRVGISLSILMHLILDQKCNPARHPLTYFLSHRIAKKFNADEILKPGYRLASGTH